MAILLSNLASNLNKIHAIRVIYIFFLLFVLQLIIHYDFLISLEIDYHEVKYEPQYEDK
jgi:hypothetical protein